MDETWTTWKKNNSDKLTDPAKFCRGLEDSFATQDLAMWRDENSLADDIKGLINMAFMDDF